MNYDKGSITAFLDGAAPFNDAVGRQLLANPIIRKMAEDIETLYQEKEVLNKFGNDLLKIISRQRKLMLLGGVLCFTAASVQYYKDKKTKEEQKKSE